MANDNEDLDTDADVPDTDDVLASGETDGPRAPNRGREPRTVPAGLFVLAVLVAGVLGIFAIIALGVDDSDDGTDAGPARTAAGDYAERFLALSHDSFDAWLEDMRSIGTAGFAESVGRRERELRTLLSENQVSWQGSAIDVFLTDESDGLVSAVVLYDLDVTDQEGTRVIPDQYLRVDLVEGRDGWLVERVLSITSDASALVSGANPPPDTTPPATTPTTDAGG